MFGPHIHRYSDSNERLSITDHIEEYRTTAKYESNLDIKAAAIFVANPRKKEINLHPDERILLSKYIKDSGITIVAHSTFTAYPWNGSKHSAHFIREELRLCSEVGIKGLVVHLPRAPREDVMKYVSRLIEPNVRDVRLYFEIPAESKLSFFETPEKLIDLYTEIRTHVDPKLDYFGLCIDTAHLWTCGVDIASKDNADDWISGIESVSSLIPSDKIMMHLNDSKREFHFGQDQHDALAVGKIWEPYRNNLCGSGLFSFINYARRHNMITILERNPADGLINDYNIIQQLAFS